MTPMNHIALQTMDWRDRPSSRHAPRRTSPRIHSRPSPPLNPPSPALSLPGATSPRAHPATNHGPCGASETATIIESDNHRKTIAGTTITGIGRPLLISLQENQESGACANHMRNWEFVTSDVQTRVRTIVIFRQLVALKKASGGCVQGEKRPAHTPQSPDTVAKTGCVRTYVRSPVTSVAVPTRCGKISGF